MSEPTSAIQVPNGWQRVRVGDVCESIDYGYTASANFSCGAPKFLRITDIQNGRVDWNKVPGCEISADAEATNRLVDGDIVFARTGGTTGKSFLIREPPRAVFASYLIRLRPNSRVTSDFIYAFFQSDEYWRQVNSHARGGAQPNVNATLLGSISLAIPPLAEQERIANVLRHELAALDRAHAATAGQLKATNALAAAFLRDVFEKDRAANWLSHRLGDVIDRYNFIIHPGDRCNGTAPFVGLEHIEADTGRRTGSLTLDLTALTGRKPMFKTGQIVYGYLRPYLNKVWIAEFDGCSSVDQFAFDVRRDLADVEFVAAFLRSDTFLRRSAAVTTTGQLPRISIDEILRVAIDLPQSVEEQRRVVSMLSMRLDASLRLRDACIAQIEGIEAMRASVLRAAFQGNI